MLVLGALAAAVVVAGVGLRAGLFEAVGRVARPLVVAAVTVVAVVAGAMAAVVGWIGDRLHIDFRKGVDKVRRALAQHHRRTGASHHYWNLLWLDRLLGLLLVAFTVWVLVRMIRRFRERPAWRRRWLMGRTAVREAGPPEPEPAGGRRWRRRVLPGDAARRWYAEALLLLETRGVDRAGATTPREYRVEVAEAIPASAHGFGVLTQAYEEVRYGGVTFDRSRLRALRRDRDAAMDAIRRARRVGPPPEPRTPATEEPRWTADRPEGEDGAGPRAPGRPDGGSGR
jgi:hypothetical protein